MNHSSPARVPLSFILAMAAGEIAGYSAILATNVPAQPLTANRVAALPPDLRQAWRDYLARSMIQRNLDDEFLKAELREHSISKMLVPVETRTRAWIPMNRPMTWYSLPEALNIADGIVSFQAPSGGWSKNLDMSGGRSPGMLFGPNNTPLTTPANFDLPAGAWGYTGTFDNEATVIQLRFLAKVISASDGSKAARYQATFLKGMEFILAAQYPNGGWPQVWPLGGSYHDAITFNDGATVNILNLLRAVSNGTNEFAFAPLELRQKSATALNRGIKCVLESQVMTDGWRTAWPQQCDMITLKATAARNYEMPAVASAESASILQFLLRSPDLTAEMENAIHGAAAWFERVAIRDKAYRTVGSEGRLLVSAPGEGPIWSRYYEIGTDRPIFGDRDKTIHDSLDQISMERRAGYSWFTDNPAEALKEYARWREAHPRR